jgi:hypothetical protein
MSSFIGSTGATVDEPTEEDWQQISEDLKKGGKRRSSRKSRGNKRKSRRNKRKSRRNKRR